MSTPDEDEGENEYDEIQFEGVEYHCHRESLEVLETEEFGVMGTWNKETQSIEWEDDDTRELHETKKADLA